MCDMNLVVMNLRAHFQETRSGNIKKLENVVDVIEQHM